MDGNEATVETVFTGMIKVEYQRNELAIYTHTSTEYANFVIFSVKVKIDGELLETNKPETHLSTSLITNIEGNALHLEKVGTQSLLTSCELDLNKNAKYSKGLSVSLQKKLLETSQTCITSKLCSQLGYIGRGDYIRAKLRSYDFNENSVLSKTFQETHPLIDVSMKNKEAVLQVTINLLVDFLIASAVAQLHSSDLGFIDLAPLDETMVPAIFFMEPGYFIMDNPKFGDLRRFKKIKDISIFTKGFESVIEGSFVLYDAKIISQYLLKHPLVDSNGTMSITIDEILLNIKTSVNYNQSPCKVASPHMYFEIGNIDFKIDKSAVFNNFTNDNITNLIHRLSVKLVNFVEVKFKDAIKNLLDTLDCEKYRS